MILPDEVQKAAVQCEEENLRFRRFLKDHVDSDELDRQFAKLHMRLFSAYDCSKCGNCCQTYDTLLQQNEIDQIAEFLELDRQEFVSKYLNKEIDGYELQAPCVFLDANGKCSIESCKPTECRDFPYTDQPNRLDSLLNTISIAEECPIVFEIIEELKRHYKFGHG